jgi:hypothetical protein
VYEAMTLLVETVSTDASSCATWSTRKRPNIQLFGPAHLCILGLVILLAAVLAIVQRRLGSHTRWLRFVVGTALVCDAAMYSGYLL